MEGQAFQMVGAAALIPYLLEGLKKAAWFPWITEATTAINRWIGIVAALAVTAGLHYEWSPDTRVLSMTIPTLAAFVAWMFNALVQWGLQEYVYRTGVQLPKVGGGQ
jgi:hypothetical protein